MWDLTNAGTGNSLGYVDLAFLLFGAALWIFVIVWGLLRDRKEPTT